ncbi:T9SS type A sorting domain-containing protein, partial [Fulvivirgaceae bacterium PWU5]
RIQITNKALTFGQKSTDEREYSLQGTLDEVRLYHVSLDPEEIATLPTRWNNELVTGLPEETGDQFTVYPNPTQENRIYLSGLQSEQTESIHIYDLTGRLIDSPWTTDAGAIRVDFPTSLQGIVVLRVQTTAAIFYKRFIIYR